MGANHIAEKQGLTIDSKQSQPQNEEIKSEDHRIAGHVQGCTIRYETKFEVQEIENIRLECKEWTETICTTKTRPNCYHTHEKKCEKHWEQTTIGKKVWVDNPESCKFYDTTDCQPITKHRPELKHETECNQVPYQHCDRVKDTTCHDIPKKDCRNEPYQDCKEITIQ